MGIDADFNDTIMHVSGNIMKEQIRREVREHVEVRYIVPGNKST
jgi:hypothetical protein